VGSPSNRTFTVLSSSWGHSPYACGLGPACQRPPACLFMRNRLCRAASTNPQTLAPPPDAQNPRSPHHRRLVPRRRTGPAPTLLCRRLGAAPKLCRKVRILPVSLFEFPCRVRVARARRRRPSAPPRSPPPSSPACLHRCPGSTPCNASYTPVLSPPKIVPPSRRSDRLARAPPPRRRSLPAPRH
jgi:hypothetical protein